MKSQVTDLKEKGLKGVIWNFSSNLIKQIISLVVSMFLARLLTPEDYGLVGMASVFVVFTQGFADLGLTSGIVNQSNPSKLQLSSVFYFNIIVSLILAFALYYFAPFVASFYNDIRLVSIVKFISYSYLAEGLTSVHKAILYKKVDIKSLKIASLVSVIISGSFSIVLAFQGYGVWSLLYGSLLGSIIRSVMIWYFARWFPSLKFSFTEIKKLMPFGINIFVVNYLEIVYSKVGTIFVGKVFSANTLGLYYRAESLNKLVQRFTSQSLSGIIFPTISSIKDDMKLINMVYEKLLHVIYIISFFLLGIVVVSAKELVILLFSDKWIDSVNYFRILACSSFVLPLSILFNGILAGTGNSKLQLKVEVLKKTIAVFIALIGVNFGLYGLLFAMVIAALIGYVISLKAIQKVTNYHLMKSLTALVPYVFMSLSVGMLIFYLTMDIESNLLTLILRVLGYTVLFISFSYMSNTYGYRILFGLFSKHVLQKR